MAKVTILVNGLDGLDLITELGKIIGKFHFAMQRISQNWKLLQKILDVVLF